MNKPTCLRVYYESQVPFWRSDLGSYCTFYTNRGTLKKYKCQSPTPDLLNLNACHVHICVCFKSLPWFRCTAQDDNHGATWFSNNFIQSPRVRIDLSLNPSLIRKVVCSPVAQMRKIKTQRGKVICPRPHRQSVVKLGFVPGLTPEPEGQILVCVLRQVIKLPKEMAQPQTFLEGNTLGTRGLTEEGGCSGARPA